MTIRQKRSPRPRSPVATHARRTVTHHDLEQSSRNPRRAHAAPLDNMRADPSTANDLNAGRGTEGPRDADDTMPIDQAGESPRAQTG